MTAPTGRPTFLESDRVLARYVARPLQRFLRVEAAGGLLLLAATIVALGWANSPAQDAYARLFGTEITLRIGSFALTGDLTDWINDGLMTLFFFVVGLEIKRELVAGELRDRRTAALPVIAALGGMVVPALIYVAFNAGGPGARGWGVPMATDIAFALGVVAILGSRVPAPLKLFLLTLAIVDDIGAIIVIAVFYAGSIRIPWLVAAVAVVGAVVVLRSLRVVYPAVYVALGLSLWVCVFRSGVHATIAGVVMGLLTPARAWRPELDAGAVLTSLEAPDPGEDPATAARRASFLIRGSVPLTERLEDLLHPWTSYLVIPVFALANAGIEITRHGLTNVSSITAGVAVGLVVGKTVGVTGSAWLAVRAGVARLPDGVRWTQVLGIGTLAGIGFTVALFVTGLAFTSTVAQDDAKVGILVASILAAAVGGLVLSRSARTGETGAEVSATSGAS
jgi:NhaA family Na+:H+ antiporter